MTQELVQAAATAFHSGKLEEALQLFREIFNATPDFLADETAHYIATFSAHDRRQFWQAPLGLFQDSKNLKSTFELIYDRSVWGGGSGTGSNLQYTLIYAAYAQHLIDRADVRTIVDLGCGDWRFSKYLDLKGRDYLGVDIVPSVIDANTAAYGSAHIRFQAADITTFEIPPCDLLLCKDVLQHLSNANVQAILGRARIAGIAAITNDYYPVNEDCENGSTRPIDITAKPFSCDAKPRLAFMGKVTFVATSKPQTGL